MLTGGVALAEFFGTERLTSDIDLRIILTDEDIENCKVNNIISENKTDRKQKSILKLALDDARSALINNVRINAKIQIHRFRKMDKSKIYWKLSDFYDIYMIKTLYPEADNWISAEMKNLNEIFGFGEDRKSSMLKIKENLLYLKKNIDRIANDFYTQVNQMLSDRSALKNNKAALNVVFSKSIDIAFQEAARMEAANERGIENIQTSILKFRN